MKRTIYILLAGILGLLLGLVFHAVFETLILRAGVPWSYWHPTYHVPFTIITSVGGFAFGCFFGQAVPDALAFVAVPSEIWSKTKGGFMHTT